MQIQLDADFLSSVKRAGKESEDGHLYRWNFLSAFRQKGMGKQPFLHLFLLNCLELKKIIMPKWYMLG